MFDTALFNVVIEFKNGKDVVNFLLFLRKIPVEGCTDNNLYLARNSLRLA